MTMGLKRVVSDGPLIWMSPSIGLGCDMIGLKKNLGVGTGKIRIAPCNRGKGTFWGHCSRKKFERTEGRRKGERSH